MINTNWFALTLLIFYLITYIYICVCVLTRIKSTYEIHDLSIFICIYIRKHIRINFVVFMITTLLYKTYVHVDNLGYDRFVLCFA